MSATKTFLAVLSAILVAAVIFAVSWAVISEISGWEKRKDGCLSLIGELNSTINEAYQDSKGGSLAELEAGLRVMNRVSAHIGEVQKTLKNLLEHKPFSLPLTSEEKKLLADISKPQKEQDNDDNDARSHLNAGSPANQIHEENVIEDASHPPQNKVSSTAIATANTPQESYYLTLTKPTELKDSVGHVVAKLQAGQSLQYTYRDGYVAVVRYEGRDYEIRTSSTELK
jgi:hypothetical protein